MSLSRSVAARNNKVESIKFLAVSIATIVPSKLQRWYIWRKPVNFILQSYVQIFLHLHTVSCPSKSVEELTNLTWWSCSTACEKNRSLHQTRPWCRQCICQLEPNFRCSVLPPQELSVSYFQALSQNQPQQRTLTSTPTPWFLMQSLSISTLAAIWKE